MCNLILYDNQKEFLSGISKHKKFQVEKEIRYILKASQVVSRYYYKKECYIEESLLDYE